MTRCALALLECAVNETGYATPEEVGELCREIERLQDRVAALERDQGLAVVVNSRVKIEEEEPIKW